MKLIVGLGNIGAHFDGTRHNSGFAALDMFATQHHLDWSVKNKLKASVAVGEIDGQKILLAKPATYYNLSGEAVQAIQNFYKISDILVIHDELALPLGIIRIRPNGSDAGNNGIKSIISHIGSDFSRIRIGIQGEHADKTDIADYVVGHFTAAENELLRHTMSTVLKTINNFIQGALEHTTLTATPVEPQL